MRPVFGDLAYINAAAAAAAAGFRPPGLNPDLPGHRPPMMTAPGLSPYATVPPQLFDLHRAGKDNKQ